MREIVLFMWIINEAYEGHDVTKLLMELLNQAVIPHNGLTINAVLDLISRFNFVAEVFHFNENNELIEEPLTDFITNQEVGELDDFSATMRTFQQQGFSFRFQQPSNAIERLRIPNTITFVGNII